MAQITAGRHRDGNSNGIGWNFVNITTNTTTTVKSSAGVVHTITINTKGATGNTLKIYDGTAATGTLIGTFDTTANVSYITLDVYCATNITVVTATGTAGDFTVTYI